jgi:hypothetical protein
MKKEKCTLVESMGVCNCRECTIYDLAFDAVWDIPEALKETYISIASKVAKCNRTESLKAVNALEDTGVIKFTDEEA